MGTRLLILKMQRQSLNMDIQPIMLDMNSIIETHVTQTVRSINIRYVTCEIEQQKKKLDMLEKELNRLLNEDSTSMSSHASVTDNQNIELEINDTPKETITGNTKAKKVVKKSEPESDIVIDETKTNKVVGEPQTKKVTTSYFDTFINKPSEEDPVEDKDNSEQPEDESVQEEEEGVYEIEVDGVSYYTTDDVNGQLYTVDENGEPGDVVGRLQDGEPIFD
jgi:hypothetical protein